MTPEKGSRRTQWDELDAEMNRLDHMAVLMDREVPVPESPKTPKARTLYMIRRVHGNSFLTFLYFLFLFSFVLGCFWGFSFFF